ncbi:hypothetical protein [Sulfurimonas sp.]|uniref:hypothetical protein n=1 Tax=Sulfurimonas sp. TaxID=2022749 RepID=UPI003BA92946
MKLAILLVFMFISIEAKHLHKEKYYQQIFCKEMRGIQEYRLKDKSRVDCLTAEYAIEVDFANKWAEAVGQSLFYSIMTGKKAGIYLIIEQKKEEKYFHRLNKVAKKFNIKVWI